ncbi:MAG: hypothetical protein JWM60_1970, partial [Solirubrobacterales bacterium]|nr:hypothetical protein [Solirubrobacterales bacterium]
MRRSFQPIRSTAGALALLLVVLLALAGGASAAEKPGIDKPVDQFSTLGEAITPLKITGKHLASLKVTGLPQGLKLKEPPSETEATIEGTPEALVVATVTLEATNEAEPESVQFTWTVESAPGFSGTPSQVRSTVGQPITPVTVTGINLHSLTTEHLPPGLTAKQVSDSEWVIEGTPATPPSETVVSLKATNRAGTAAVPAAVTWTVEAPPHLEGPPAAQVSTAGQAIAPVILTGSNLFSVIPLGLPAGLELKKASPTQWTIEGVPTTPRAASTVTLKATNQAGGTSAPVEFLWTVQEAQKAAPKTETPAKPVETPPPATTIPSAGRLGTLPVQKAGKSLTASFLCEVASCKVQVT